MKIKKIWTTNYNDYVYDLSVEKNHNFLCENVVISNCKKKKYWMIVSDSEGVRHNFDGKNLESLYVSVTGLETQRSSTPKVLRDALLKAYKIISFYNEEKLQEFVKQFHKEFLKLKPEEIAFPTSANNIEKFLKEDGTYKKGSEGATPIGVRSAILFNKYIKEMNLENIYTPIQSGEKLKMLVLNEKNPTGENVIGFKDILPPEFGLEQYVDYETNYNKGFLEPLKSVCEAVGWSPVKKYTLDSFFG